MHPTIDFKTGTPWTLDNIDQLKEMGIFTASNVAHHHSISARWNAQYPGFARPPMLSYHVLLVHKIVSRLTSDTQTRFYALVHDVDEVVTNDIPTPVKKFLVKKRILRKIQSIAFQELGLVPVESPLVTNLKALLKIDPVGGAAHKLVKYADDIAWRVESLLLHGPSQYTQAATEADQGAFELAVSDYKRIASIYNDKYMAAAQIEGLINKYQLNLKGVAQ